MGTKDDLRQQLNQILNTAWTKRDGTVVPDETSLTLGNDAVKLEGAVLYADLAESSALVKGFSDWFAAAIYKMYLVTACRIIRSKGGEITAFDGDRVMAVFLGASKESRAVRAALALTWAVRGLLNPMIRAKWPNEQSIQHFTLKHGVGIDTSPLFVAKTGIRNANDLVWVGTAANKAAKLAVVRDGEYSTWISKAVLDKLSGSELSTEGKSMWHSRSVNNEVVYASTYHWDNVD